MTDLLRPSAPAPAGATRRPLALTAVVAGASGALGTMVVCLAAALAGWFAADAGRYGDTRDALRVGADAWLMAHGAGLDLGDYSVTVAPLGVTVLVAYVAYRLGGWVGSRASGVDLRGALVGASLLGAGHATVTVLAGVVASTSSAAPGLGRALVAGLLVGSVAGGAGLLVRSGQGRAGWRRLPQAARSAALGSLAAASAVVAASALLVAAALLLDFGTAATVLSRLHADGPGGLSYTVVVALLAPNAVLLGSAYLLGPGFLVGTGTVVSPSAVVLGPVPAFPLLAALPPEGDTPAWAPWLVLVPVVLSLATVALAVRRGGFLRYETGAAVGLLAGMGAAVLLTTAAWAAGGSAGPGRMSDVGVGSVLELLLAATIATGGAGLLGGLVGTWRTRATTATTTVTVAVSESVAERGADGATRETGPGPDAPGR